MKPNNIILEGITGSQAYGLATEDSDEDIKGIYAVSTEDILGVFSVKETHDHVDPDWVYHEVGKAINLFMKANPTLLELLFLDGYTTLTKFGKLLVDNRELFLSNAVKASYGGYALSQARKLNARGGTYGNGRNKRFSKHSRHCLRLLYQGKELLETGTLTVRVTPEMRKELFAFGELPVNEVVNKFEEEFIKFNDIKSVLPDKPDKEKINQLLLRIRRGNY